MRKYSSLIIFVVVTIIVITCSIKAVTIRHSQQEEKTDQKGAKTLSADARKFFEGDYNAPDFASGLEWLNTEKPVSIKELRGKIVLLDFWTYCCINCMHIIPDLKKLEAKYADQLVVIGVHSAKFATERGTDNIRQAILRYEIEHPVVNDKDMDVWTQYSAHAWPTLVLINPKGKVVGQVSGEGVFERFDPIMEAMVEYFRDQKTLDEKPRNWKLEKYSAPPGVLNYPGKVLADERGGRVFISDSNHNRILITSLDGEIKDVIGDGAIGNKDGSLEDAELNHPQGIALNGDMLYICDTENHLIRKADLKTRSVETIVGTGRQSLAFNEGGIGTKVALNSPWDALVHDGKLFVAMAGFHQLWTIDLKTNSAGPFAGSGRENIVDGKPTEAALAQPSGVSTDGERIFFADSEVSAVRYSTFNDGQVKTIVGKGLFEFGDKDGRGDDVKLQHPLGVVYARGKLYVADTYNHKVKEIIIDKAESRTFAGGVQRGLQDGAAKGASFNEPGGISATSKHLYVADTNNHLIRKVELDTGNVSTLQLKGLDKLTKQVVRRFRGRTVEAAKITIAPGKGSISLSFTLPQGYKYNEGAPFYVAYKINDSKEVAVNFSEPKFPYDIPVEVAKGQSKAIIDAVVYFCNDDREKVCLTDSIRINVPLDVTAGAPQSAKLDVNVYKR